MNLTMEVPGRKGYYQNAGSEEDFSITCKPCRRDGTEIGAYGYCVDCEEHLCVACYGCHRRTLLTKDHNLLDKSKMPMKTVRKIPAVRSRQIDTCTEQCPDHENKFIEYYCPLHDKLGCNACITLNHRNCEGVAFIPDIEEKDEKYTTFTEEIKTISKQFQTNMKFAEENINTAKMNHSKLKEERNRFRKEIVENLDRLEQRFDNKISMLRDEDIGAMEYIKGKSDCCTKQLETMLLDVENKYKVGQVCNAFIAVKLAEDEIKTVEEELKRLQEKKEIRKIEFQPAPTLSALVDLKEFGKLSYTKKHLEASAEKKYFDVKDNSNLPLNIIPSSNAPKSTPHEEIEDSCVICMDKFDNPKKLKCGHLFCTDCIDQYFQVKQVCPICGVVCGAITGDQPTGGMEIMKIRSSVAGYPEVGAIAVTYSFPDGKQEAYHPRPGIYYRGITRTGYLPDNDKGRRICAMLRVAFNRKLVFTIGTSRTTGRHEDVIKWNDIHHKTDHRSNTQFGYPDDTYLARVTDEIGAKGVSESDIDPKFMKKLKLLCGSKRLSN